MRSGGQASIGWELAATLGKGTKSRYGSIDAQLTYPLGRLFDYFNGFGEDLPGYNQKRRIARIGFGLTR
ncbi:MAG TPA: hypothetical protein VL689_10490 [Paraburkholderia sp.]|nr:hypothetical protein [Paraburkholderia sp.]